MKSWIGRTIGLLAVLVSAIGWQHGVKLYAAEAEAGGKVMRPAPNQLRYPAGSPQLAYLGIDTVKSSQPALADPFPGRLVFDENRTVRLFSPVTGHVVKIAVDLGAPVKAGDVLALLTAPEYETAVAESRKAQADYAAKQAAWVRAQRLHEAGVIATRELESAQSDKSIAQAELERTQARMRGWGPVGPDGRFVWRAPISGVVAERHLNPGQEVRPDAAEPAFVITDPQHLDAIADVPESEVGGIHVAQAARVEFDDPAMQAVAGVVKSVGVGMDSRNRRVPLRISLKAVPTGARAEMFVRLAVLDERQQPVVAVPNQAIVTTGQQSFVFVERSPGLLVKTPISLLRRGRDVSYVSQGLQAGQRIVTQRAILLDAELTADH